MNASKMILNLIIKRSYRSKGGTRRLPNPGIQSRLNILEDDPENELDAIENLDLDDAESDFMQAHRSYDSYKKEMKKNKDLLKLRIVTRKYFNKPEPSLLTFIEKEQIRHLHNSDPLEYNVEKLSESFPALPHTIRKILKANWTAKSAERVLKHDQLVIENWKKYKLGELTVEPQLKEHLDKFKGRIISLPNKEEIEKKLLPPPRDFPKPKSNLYSGIIQSYLEQNEDRTVNEEETTSSAESKLVAISRRFDENSLTCRPPNSDRADVILNPRYANEIGNPSDENKRTQKTGKVERGNGRLTLDKFFESSVKKIDGAPSIEDKVLMDTYKRKIEADMMNERKIAEDNQLRVEKLNSKSDKFDSVTLLTEKDLPGLVDGNKNLESIQVVNDSKDSELTTYVKSRETKNFDEDNYPELIAIPRKKYKRGKLYKLRDCYYDDDGEFLYRVPGLTE